MIVLLCGKYSKWMEKFILILNYLNHFSFLFLIEIKYKMLIIFPNNKTMYSILWQVFWSSFNCLLGGRFPNRLRVFNTLVLLFENLISSVHNPNKINIFNIRVFQFHFLLKKHLPRVRKSKKRVLCVTKSYHFRYPPNGYIFSYWIMTRNSWTDRIGWTC